jgi:acetyl esterase/lipase
MLLCLLFTLPVRAQDDDTPPIRDVPYATASDRQELDVYLPEDGAGPFPTILVIPGGGPPRGGNKASQITQGEYFARRGYAAVVPTYRGDIYGQAEDVFCVWAWAHAHADDYGFDATRMAAFGYSAGGWLSALLGLVDDPAAFLTDCEWDLPEDAAMLGVATFGGFFPQPATMFRASDWVGGVTRESGVPRAEVAAAFAEAAPLEPDVWADVLDETLLPYATLMPLYWLDEDDPPFLLFHGLADRMVPLAVARTMVDVLEAAGVTATLHELERISHGYPNDRDTYAPFAGPLDDFMAGIFAGVED